MARFLKLTNAMRPQAGAPLAINIDQITAIIPFDKNDPYLPNASIGELEKPATLVYTGTMLHIVQESFEKITNSLPN